VAKQTTRELTDTAQGVIDIKFNNEMLLALALTHRSFAHESLAEHHLNNEKLEFLGDSVLNFVVTADIFNQYNGLAEGDLAKLRSNLVNADVLATVAQRIGLGDCILLGRGAERSGGRERTSILSDTFEAIVGAIYLDRGFKVAREFILDSFGDEIEVKAGADYYSDYKSSLQEIAAKKGAGTPDYSVVNEDGPDHDRTFHVEVSINGSVIGRGSGKSKKKAEQTSAKEGLSVYGIEGERA